VKTKFSSFSDSKLEIYLIYSIIYNIAIQDMKLHIESKYIYRILIGIIIIILAIFVFIQTQQIKQFRQEQIQRNNLISKEFVEEPILDGLKPQIINIQDKKQTLYLPEKFKISILTQGFKSPQFVKSDDKGNLFVTDSEANTLWIVSNENQQQPKVVDNKLQGIMSLDWYKGSVYIVTDTKVIQYIEIQSDGSYKERKTLIDNLPKPHNNTYHTISVHNDRIYIAIAANCETCQPKDKKFGSVVSYSIDGKDEQLFAKGLKQITDIVLNENNFVVTDIGRTGISNQLPTVEINKIEEGKDYGWPYCYGDANVDPKYTEQSDFCKNKAESSVAELPKDNGVAGFALIPNQFYNAFANNYVFIYQGGQNKSIPKGYKVVIKDINKDSSAKNFITGWLLLDGTIWGSPKGVTFDNNGAMIVTDQKNGLLYKVTQE
jgi:glucose/arabinose dehydrogenase